MPSLQILFEKAAETIRDSKAEPTEEINDQVKLQFYGLYKQATVGDCQESAPWKINLVARAKWDAWNSLKGTNKEEAMKKYVKLFDQYHTA